MIRSKIASVAKYLPENVVTNSELTKHIDTSDEWIRNRTGIEERRFATRFKDTTSTMGFEAAKLALTKACISASEIDFIIFATLSPDYYFPGCGVLLQRHLGISEIGALDIRNQCSGFIYALSVADQFIRTGMYRRILVVGAEYQSAGLDFSTRGRDVTVLFGDGAGAVILVPSSDSNKGILSTHLHADGTYAEKLANINPGMHTGVHSKDISNYESDLPYGGGFITNKMMEKKEMFPYMSGQDVFEIAVRKFPEVIRESLEANGMKTKDLDLLIPHQANLRISKFVQKKLELPDSKVFNNIHKYGNTTSASIPIAICEAIDKGRLKDGDLLCLAAFGSGFAWGSALIRW